MKKLITLSISDFKQLIVKDTFCITHGTDTLRLFPQRP
jgi:L-asparaginase/Glu-tRNA(Gln) amidotransferase subunit D